MKKFEESSSDEKMEELLALKQNTQRSKGSTSREPRRYIDRNILEGHERLFNDYFAQQPAYPPEIFRRRFHMNRELFFHIQSTVEANEPYFQQRRNGAGQLGLSSLQKVTAAMRMLAYGVAADSIDEYVRSGESTSIKTLKKFVKAIISIFGDEYLRSPKPYDVDKLIAIGEKRGFPGMLGSIDCMHWKWKNCLVAWPGNFSGHVRKPTIILEAVASYDLWIWHAFFGLPGSFNDINVLERSNVFAELAEGRTPLVNYWINGNHYTMGYYLADGIYPSWKTFVKTIPEPRGAKIKHFAQCQESARKDVEREFGVLQERFKIVREPARLLDINVLYDVMIACIILHNMIVENERDLHPQPDISSIYDPNNENSRPTLSREPIPEYREFILRDQAIRNREVHSTLQSDLIEHLWNIHGES